MPTRRSKHGKAAPALATELARLQQSGTLLANELAPRIAGTRDACPEVWTTKPGTESVLLLWCGFGSSENPKSALWREFAPPTWAPQATTFLAGLDTSLVQFSSSGQWLAACQGWRERRVSIWNAQTGRRMTEQMLSGPVSAMCFSADEKRLFLAGAAAGAAAIWSLATNAQAGNLDELRIAGAVQFRLMAPHPGGTCLAVECGGRLGLLDLAPPLQLRTLNLGGGLDVGRAMTKELESPAFERKFANLKQEAPAGLGAMLEKLLSAEKEICRRAAPVPLERLLALEFTRDGRWLICGTSEGVRVFECAKLCDPEAKLVKWDYTAAAEEPDRTLDKWATKQVHCVGFDSVRQRVLFSGEEGKLKYLDLGTGRTSELLGGPERTPITRFALSGERKIIALTRVQGGHGNERRARFQIWSYPALCAAAGVEF